MRKRFFSTIFFMGTALLVLSCDSFVTEFGDVEAAVNYEAADITDLTNTVESIKVMTWNIRFGVGRTPWFGDSCGDRVIMNEQVVLDTLQKIADYIDNEGVDIILLQEVDVSSKRTAYLDQVQWLLDHTSLNYGAYGSMWQADFVASDGLGKVDAGNAVLSKWPISDAERIQLPLRGDQDPLTQYFYLRRNLIKVLVDLPQTDNDLYVVDIHATAFATDDTKQKHVQTYKTTLADLNDAGESFVTGGDLNSVPPSLYQSADDNYYGDYCVVDGCQGDDIHKVVDGETVHSEGSYFNNFDGELELMQPFYDSYEPAIPSSEINSDHFTHGTWNTSEADTDKGYWDRKLDYLFTNHLNGNWRWQENSTQTHQDAWSLSDHAPVSGILVLKID